MEVVVGRKEQTRSLFSGSSVRPLRLMVLSDCEERMIGVDAGRPAGEKAESTE
jgi:hypothetical protein